MLQAVVDDVHEQFIDDIRRGRKWSEEKAKSLADGRIFTGRQAQSVGLVDEIGSFAKAIQAAADAAGIEGEPQLRSYGRKTFLEQLMETSATAFGTAFARGLTERLDTGSAEQLLRRPGL